MNQNRVMPSLIFALFLLCASVSSCAHSVVVSVMQIDANPISFHKKNIDVRGILGISLAFGPMLYVSKRDAEEKRMESALDLFIPPSGVRKLEAKYGEKPVCVIVSGKFYKYNEGEIMLDAKSTIGMIQITHIRPCR